MQKMMVQLNQAPNITDDFLAAFLQAGIPPNRLGHPSMSAGANNPPERTKLEQHACKYHWEQTASIENAIQMNSKCRQE